MTTDPYRAALDAYWKALHEVVSFAGPGPATALIKAVRDLDAAHRADLMQADSSREG